MTTMPRTPASLSAALYDPETAAIYGVGPDLSAARADARAGLLCAGERIGSFRVEGAKVIAFPVASIWHSIIITPEGA